MTDDHRAGSPPRWRPAAHAAPAIHEYGGEFVVHHALSNDTYRLSAGAGAVLKALLAVEGGTGSFAETMRAEDPQTEATLNVLAELGFVTRC